MKFMKLEDLEVGDKICINTKFLRKEYGHLYKTLRSKELYIVKIRVYNPETFRFYLSRNMKYEEYIITIYNQEVCEDYPIKIIKLREEE